MRFLCFQRRRRQPIGCGGSNPGIGHGSSGHAAAWAGAFLLSARRRDPNRNHRSGSVVAFCPPRGGDLPHFAAFALLVLFLAAQTVRADHIDPPTNLNATAMLTVTVNDDSDTGPDNSLTATAGADPTVTRKSRATYTITITGLWDNTVTPNGVPPGAHFTTFAGAVHNEDVTLLTPGQAASAGVELLAETGRTGTLANEVAPHVTNGNADRFVSFAAPATNSARDHTGVVLTSDHPRITLLSMIAPTPDWFVGVAGLRLLDSSGNWVASQSVNLYPWDAGTEQGDRFNLVNPDGGPPTVITSIRGRGQFTGKPIARIAFTRTAVEQAPAAPQGAAAAPTDGGAALSWTEPATNSGITKHQYRQKSGTNNFGAWTDIPDSKAGTGTGTANNAGYTVAGLTNGTKYTFQLRAVNAIGAGEASDDLTATPRSVPDAPTVSGVTVLAKMVDNNNLFDRVRLTYTAPASDGGRALSCYQLQHDDNSSFNSPSLHFMPPTAMSPADREILTFTASTQYFRLRATNDTGVTCATGESSAQSASYGSWSATFTLPAAPGPVQNLVAEGGERISGLDATTIRLTWTVPATGTPVSYQVWHREDNGLYSGAGSNVMATEFDVTGLNAGTSYDFRVRAIDANGRFGPSAFVDDVSRQPAAPESLSATASTTTTDVTVNWNAVTAGTDIVEYLVQYNADSTGHANWMEGAVVEAPALGQAPPTTATVSGLAASTDYRFRVRAHTEHRWGWFSSEATATTAAVGASLTASPSLLTETNLHGAVLTVTLAGTQYESSLNTSQFTLTATPAAGGLRISNVRRASASEAALTLAFTGNLTEDTNLAVEVAAAAHTGSGTLTTGAVTASATRAATVTVTPGALRVAAVDDPATGDTDERKARYTITLTRRPSGTVTITPQSSDPAIAAVTGPLTFTRSNWDTPQTLTVTGAADGRVGIDHRISGGGYNNVAVPEVTVTVGDGGADPRKTLAPPPCTSCGEGVNTGPQQDPGDTGGPAGTDTTTGADGQGGTDTAAGPDTTGGADAQTEQPGMNATGSTDVPDVQATEPDTPDSTHQTPLLPDGALAALAQGYLTSARQVLGSRLNPEADARMQLTLAGQTLSLSQLLTPGAAGSAFDPDFDRPPDAPGLSWDQATGRCAAWYTASCATSESDGLGNPVYGQQSAGPWDTLFYRLTTGLLQGTTGDALWQGSEFALTLGGGDEPGAPGQRWTLWGRGHVQALAGLPADFTDGTDLRSGYLGIDTHLGANARAGFALSRSLSEGTLTTVHPYLSWSDGATSISAFGGIGRGSADPVSPVQDNPYAAYDAVTDRPLGLRMGLVEVQRQLGMLGEITLDVRGDAAWAQLSADNGIETQTETVRTLRLGAGAKGQWQVGRLTLAPALETHLRHDTGHGPTGRGLELLGGLSATHGDLRLTVQGRMLTTRSEAAYRERGLQTTLALGQPGQLGPSLSLSARWGDAATGGDTLWREQLHYQHSQARNNAWSLDARSEVGLTLPGGRLLTGFASVSHAGDGPRALVGLRMGLGATPAF